MKSPLQRLAQALFLTASVAFTVPVAEATLFGPPLTSRGGVRWHAGISVGTGRSFYGPYRHSHYGGPRVGYGRHGYGQLGYGRSWSHRGYHRDPFYIGGTSWRHDPFYTPLWAYGSGYAWGRAEVWPRERIVVRQAEPRRSRSVRSTVTTARDDLRDARSADQLRAIYGDQAAGLTR